MKSKNRGQKLTLAYLSGSVFSATIKVFLTVGRMEDRQRSGYFIIFLKRRGNQKSRADTGVCPYIFYVYDN